MSAAGYQVTILGGLLVAARLDPRTTDHALLTAKHDGHALGFAAGAILSAAGHEPSDEDRALFVARFLGHFADHRSGEVTMLEAEVLQWIAARRHGTAPRVGYVVSIAPRLSEPVAVTEIVAVGDERAVPVQGPSIIDAVDALLRRHTGRRWPIPDVERLTRHLFERFIGEAGVVQVTIQAAAIDRFVDEAQRAAG